jgi:hypothetical protein
MNTQATLHAVADETVIAEAEAQVTVSPQGGYVAFTCPDVVSKDNDANYDPARKEEPSAADQGRMDEGRDFESELGRTWPQILGARMIVIPECDRSVESKRHREELTMAALADPGDAVIIWNARLSAILEDREAGILPRIAEPDFLVLAGRRHDGRPIWSPGDVKHHKTMEGQAKGLLWKVSTLDLPQFGDADLRDLGAGMPKVKPSKQLAHYRRVLEHYGYAQDVSDGSPYWACTIGKEGVLIWRDLDAAVGRPKKSPQKAYDEGFAHRIDVIRRAKARGINPAIPALTEPDWCNDCKTGAWRTVIHDELKLQLGHIALLPGVTPARLGAHFQSGVRKVTELAGLHYPTAVAVDAGLDVPALIKTARAADPALPASAVLGSAALLPALTGAGVRTVGDVAGFDTRTAAYTGSKVWNLAGLVDIARVSLADRVCRARGVQYVAVPRAAIEVDVDVEDSGPGGIVYLIGARALGFRRYKVDGEVREKVRVEMHSFTTWENTDEAEAKVFADFWSYVVGMRAHAKARKHSLRFYHYTAKEVSTFRSLARKHEGLPGIPTLDELEELFDSPQWVDLFPILSQQLIWPTESMSLKALAKKVAFSWRDEAPGGDNSIAWYREAVGHPDEKVRDEMRERILIYNEDDVIAQAELRLWVSRFGEARMPGKKLPSVESLETRFGGPVL